MITLHINGQGIDLSPDTKISMEEESPVFDPLKIPGGFSFPFTLPASLRNSRILGHPSRIESKVHATIDLPFELRSRGRLIGSGTASIQTTTSREFSVYLQFSSGDFAGKIEGKKLSDVDYGGAREWVFKSEYTAQTDDFTLFPVYNPNFMDDTGLQTPWAADGNRLNAYSDGHFDNTVQAMAITPFPFLSYVVNQIFNFYGFPVKESILATDPDLSGLVIYSPVDISSYPIVNTLENRTYPGVYEINSFNGDYILDGNGQRVLKIFQVKVSTTTRQLDTWDLKDSLPDMLISDFILTIRTMFNLAFIITPLGSVLIRKRIDIVSSGDTEKIDHLIVSTPKMIVEQSSPGIFLRYTHEENDLVFSDEFKDVFENEKLLQPSVNSISDLSQTDPSINEIRLVRSYGQYYQYAGTEVNGVTTYEWKFYSNDFQDFRVGDTPEELTALASTLPMIHYQRTVGGPYYRVPIARQLSSSRLRQISLPFGLRFLFYRGLVDDSQGNLYPYGSSDPFNSKGELLPGAGLSLKWDGPQGIYEQLWKEYLSWWDHRRPVTFTVTDPSALNFHTIYGIQNSRFLLKKKSLNIDAQGHQPVECEFYLV